MKELRVYTESWDIKARLKELGLGFDEMIDVVKASVAAHADCTSNDPPSAPGWTAWRAGVRRLREIFCSAHWGWEKDDTDQFSTIANDHLYIKVAVCNSDDGTAIEDRVPRNRSRKGVVSERATDRNTAPYLFPEMDQDKPKDRSAYSTWYLCLYIEGDRVRAELSFPSAFESGYFTRYSERVFILSRDDWNGLDFSQRDDESGPDLEITVRRK